jgi:hypothetical protein
MGKDNNSYQENFYSEAFKKNEQEQQEQEKEQEKKEEEIDIKRFKDVSGLTLRKLNFGLWYVKHKLLLRRIFIGFLIVVSAVFWAYSIYGFAYYITRGVTEDELLVRGLVRSGQINHNAILSMSPKNLKFGRTRVFKSFGEKYDFLIRAENPNKRHGAEFEYFFIVGDKETTPKEGFILPGETKYFLSLSNEFSARPINARFKTRNFRWKRIDRHEIPDWDSYKNDRLSIEISGINFIPSNLSGLSEKIDLNQLEFTAVNGSAYNYWNVSYIILFFGGNNIVAVNQFDMEEFMSGEERQVSMRWPGAVGRVSKVEIIPEVNIMRDDVYIEIEGGPGELK